MAKAEVEVQFTFTLPIDESVLQHKADAERKAKEAFVLELLRHGILVQVELQNSLIFRGGISQT